MGTVIQKQGCPHCASSDAYALYDDNSGYCFSCNTYDPSDDSGPRLLSREEQDELNLHEKHLQVLPMKGKVRAISDRGINRSTCDRYGVTTAMKDGVMTHHFYPYFVDTLRTSYKKRRIEDKVFSVKGEINKCGLFGMQEFSSRGKYVTVVEGEIDAMSAFQMLGSKWPVVSLKNGSSGIKRDLKNRDIYQWLSGFEHIIVCLDADEPGVKAADIMTKAFPMGKVKVVNLKLHKDANLYLMEGDHKDFSHEWWDAEDYRPSGVVLSSELEEIVRAKDNTQCIATPFPALDKLTYGLRTGEMWTILAGTGVGKTTFIKELMVGIRDTTPHNIGGIFLEETLKKSGMGIMQAHASIPFELPDSEFTDSDFDEAVEYLTKDDRFALFDSFGENDIDKIVEVIHYLAQVHECKFIFLDHVSMLVSEGVSGDERRALDAIATKLKKLTIELDIGIVIVAHTRRTQGKPLEEGGIPSISDIRGTAGIGQLSNMAISLQRNGQDPDPVIRNTVTVWVTKNRFCGRTGPACQAYYDEDTGRLQESAEWTDEVDLDLLDELDDEEGYIEESEDVIPAEA